ncbi:MAG: gliding motility-associated C-terminal domain-containing protein, partial [Bacteroidota bacterium]|nr:gliding motility-associated C-terminal domain-containing protein [Bacteroidota bacterium]
PAALVIDSETNTNVSCNGGNDGTITITVSGGIAPYEYSIDGGTSFLANGGVFVGLTAGNYDIALRDANSCITSGATLNITEPAVLLIDSQLKTDISCNGLTDGTITITASGGTPPYQYSIDGGANFLANGGIFTGLSAGSYPVAIRDVNGCVTIGATLIIADPAALLIDSEVKTNITCNGLTDGTITITASGGIPPYQYSIDGGITFLANGGSFTGLSANNYDVAVQDANGCVTNGATLNVVEPTVLVIDSQTKTDVSCNSGNDGTISITASGGTPAYNYSIDGGITFLANGGNFTGLLTGNYDVAIRDANGCITNGTTLNVTEPPVLAIDLETSTNVLCNGDTDGTITITASGGIPPYQYSIDGGNNFLANGGSFTGLAAGNYDIALRDNNLCITNGSTLNITEPDALIIDSESKTDISCNGLNDGTITIVVSGGIAAYEYSIDGGVTFSSNGGSFSGLTAGIYDIAVRDLNLCVTPGSTISLIEPSPLNIDSVITIDVLCFGGNDGQITITASGGTPPYSYSVDGGIIYFSNGGIFNTLSAGNYDVVVRDANGCELAGGAYILNEPPMLTMIVDTSKATCNSFTNDGAIVVTAGGGTPGYTYSIDGGINWQASSDFNNLLTGTYEVVIRDINSCTLSQITNLDSKYIVNADAGSNEGICPGEGIMLQGSGGTGYQWVPGSGLSDPMIANPIATPSETTTYYLTVSQGVCNDLDSVIISVFTVPPIDAGRDTTIFKGTTFTLQATPGFNTYLWSPLNGLISSPTEASVVTMPENSILYKIVGTTLDGCESSDSIFISVIENFVIPSGFTPNGDAYNNTWVIDNAWLFPDIVVKVVNRWGQTVFYSRGYGNGIEWDGTNKGKELPIGTYYYVIILNDGGNTPPMTGPVTIIR